MRSTSRRAAASLLAACAAFAASTAWAQWKPEKPVTLVVPYSPGGGTDAQARAVAKELQRIWGQTVIVDNAPGADGLIGTRKVIDAKADGYTLLVQISGVVLTKHLPGFKGADPLTQIVPVSEFASLPGVFVASAKLPVKTVADATEMCKTQGCSFGTTETGARLLAQMYKAENGLDKLVAVNYKGGGQIITDIVSNNVNMAVMGLSAALPHLKAGTLRALASAGKTRSTVLPDTPSAAESTKAPLGDATWYGIFAPRSTPGPVVEGIAAAVREAIQSDELRKSFAILGSEAIGSTPEAFAEVVREEDQRMTALAKRFPLE